MRVRNASWSIIAITAIVGSMMGTAPATEPAADALNLQQAAVPNALIPVKATTHLEFLKRSIDGVPHTFALLGSRDRSVGSGAWTSPGAGLNIIDLTDPTNPTSTTPSPRFIQNVPCVTDNVDIAPVNVELTIPQYNAADPAQPIPVTYDQIVAISSNDSTSCVNVKDPNGVVIKYANGTTAKAGAVSFVGIRKTPAAGAVLTADWLGSPVLKPEGTKFTWTKIAHTVVPHPSRPIVYTGNQELGTRSPTVEVIDLSAWPPVVRVAPVNGAGAGPHDITFSPDGTRAFASSVTESFIWDTSGDKVFAPALISVLATPGLKLHHEGILHPDQRHLLVVDEFVATSSNGAVTATPQCPGGGVHVMDLGDARALEAAPVQVGTFFANDQSFIGADRDLEAIDRGDAPQAIADDAVAIGCTAHEYTISPDGRWMPIAWFGAGVRLFDLTSLQAADALPAPTPVNVTEFGHYKAPHTDVWAAKVRAEFPGYIFVSDSSRGFETLQVTGTLP
jgi:hypothetical protein